MSNEITTLSYRVIAPLAVALIVGGLSAYTTVSVLGAEIHNIKMSQNRAESQMREWYARQEDRIHTLERDFYTHDKKK